MNELIKCFSSSNFHNEELLNKELSNEELLNNEELNILSEIIIDKKGYILWTYLFKNYFGYKHNLLENDDLT